MYGMYYVLKNLIIDVTQNKQDIFETQKVNKKNSKNHILKNSVCLNVAEETRKICSTANKKMLELLS